MVDLGICSTRDKASAGLLLAASMDATHNFPLFSTRGLPVLR